MKDDGAFLHREAVQFHWFNRDYGSFDDFLATLRSSRRKNVRRERRMVAEQGIDVQRKKGAEISDEEWQGFYQCYMSTYRKRSGHDGYLNQDFFNRLREDMAQHLMLVVARSGDEIVASSLFLYDSNRLYGRYWGADGHYDALHFETCYYQGIDYCIERGRRRFEPGTQGEHKISRGFVPVNTWSAHWLARPEFFSAIGQYLEAEARHIDHYVDAVNQHVPYKRSADE